MQPLAPRRAPRSWARCVRRAGAIATALLLMVCIVGVQAEEAGVVHVRCVEHGQLVHVRLTGAASASDRTAGVEHIAPVHGNTPAGHEHCPLVGVSHCTRLAAAPPVVSHVATAAEPGRAPRFVRVTRTTFRIAPKTSPPA